MKTKVAVIGAGQMGQFHARIVHENPKSILTMVIDPREDVGSLVAQRYGAKWYPELPKHAEVDAVIIAAATEAHKSLAFEAIDQKLHLLIEKPIAPNYEDVVEITTAANENHLVLVCGLLERFNPAVMTAMSLVSSPLHITTARHSPYATRIRTGVSWDLLIHDVDLVIQLMGASPTGISGNIAFNHPLSEPTSEDVAEIVMGFEGNKIAHSSASRIGQRKIRQIAVYEQNRLIEVDLLRKDVTIFHNVSEDDIDNGRGYKQQTVIEIPELVSNQEPLAAQFNFFLDSINSNRLNHGLFNPAHKAISNFLTFVESKI